MTIAQKAVRSFATPSISARAALLCCLIAIAVPTLIRASVDGYVIGLAFLPYIPSVLLIAIFLHWQFAALVAVAAALTGDALFIGPPLHVLEQSAEVFGIVAFLAVSAFIIASTQVARRVVQNYGRLSKDHLAHSGIVFSVEDGQAWASWYGPGSRVCLGPQDEVAEMMKDFLAQIELGDRLASRSR